MSASNGREAPRSCLGVSYAKCHPERINVAFYLCRACYLRKRRAEARARGLPTWLAEQRSPQGWVKRSETVTQSRRRNPEPSRQSARRMRLKNARLYGGDPSRKFSARLKWLAAKSAARTQPGGDGVAAAETQTCEAMRKLRKLDPHDYKRTLKTGRAKCGEDSSTVRYLRKTNKKAKRAGKNGQNKR